MISTPIAVLHPPPARPRPRPHYTVPKPGCFCGRCRRLRRTEHLTDLIALYEERLATFRRELAEVTG